MMSDRVAPQGGLWLLEDARPQDVHTPERMTDEQRLMAQTTDEFVDREVLPRLDDLEKHDWTLARELVHRAGALGLLGIDAPEAFGGLALDTASSLIVSERMSRAGSFSVTFGAQTNLCILPITLFGTEAQKAKYLPGLIAGDLVGAYGLSESGAGSDALAAQTRAVRQPDGSWRLSGEKMWISNGGFADIFIVFARSDDEQLTAFIVERAFGGVGSGREEHKMGLHGSSTTSVLLQDVAVPDVNVLGGVGRGHKVALNTLNFGRFKLGAMCAGGSRAAVGDAARYASQRRQFGQPIATFGAIRYKLGEMVARTYAAESLVYRTAGLIDEALAASGNREDGAIEAQVFEQFAVEASIAKVAGSEALDFVLDENVQIHGGNGFVSDYAAERLFRDARVNRIFEGTNEINRLLIPGMLVRRAVKDDLPLIAAARRLQDELLSAPPRATRPEGDDEPLADQTRAVSAFKKVALMVIGTAMQTYGDKLSGEQEVLCFAADILIDTYAAESAVLRARAAVSGSAAASLHVAAATLVTNEAAQRIDAIAKSALSAMADGDTRRTLLAALRRLLNIAPVNTVALRRILADAVTARGGYATD